MTSSESKEIMGNKNFLPHFEILHKWNLASKFIDVGEDMLASLKNLFFFKYMELQKVIR